jgi:uncharacterized protein
MIKLGVYNTLKVVREIDFGFYLGDNLGHDILMPRKWATPELTLDDEISVFVYLDHEERPIATTMTPKITLGQFNYLKVSDLSSVGAFMDWGLEKDLLVPFKNQPKKFEQGKWYCIYLYLDTESNRLVGTARTNNLFSNEMPTYKIGEKVNILVCEDTDIGVNLIVDNQFRGLVYHSDIFNNIQRGDQTFGYIKKIREDGKLDISLDPIGVERFEVNAQKILDYINLKGGSIALTDKSDPDLIYAELEMSKKTFKAALGILYKAKKISLDKNSTKTI